MIGYNFLCITGDPGSGKTAVCKLLEEKMPQYSYYSTGYEFRRIAEDIGISVNALSELAEETDDIDHYIDNKLRELGVAEDKYIVDSRMAWHFIPNSVSVYLSVKDIVAAERIMTANRATESFHSISEAITQVNTRRKSEQTRYQEKYHIDLHDAAQYDIVIDTSDKTAKDVAKEVLVGYIEKRLRRPLSENELKNVNKSGLNSDLQAQIDDADKLASRPAIHKEFDTDTLIGKTKTDLEKEQDRQTFIQKVKNVYNEKKDLSEERI